MISQLLNTLYHRDLNRLKEELNAYGTEEQLWLVPPGISNSAGNLALHLVGNLNHFLGATLGQTGYIRNRDAEFSLKSIPRHELIRSIDGTIAVVQQVLTSLTDEDMQKAYPLKVVQGGDSALFMLMHLLAHLDYHLGQINYHRRLTAN